ncbi:MAG: inositol 2-dehydrogenase, partial [Methyloceanibacter sp.]|nr:inositol 2-dehydrogenase [Methyloceanibacter sp.]
MANDPLLLIVEMAGGVIADIELFINAAYGYDVRAELVCGKGTMQLARPAAGDIRRAGQEGTAFPPDWRGRFEDAYRLELQSWVDAIRNGGVAGASAWDGYVAEAVAEAGVRALKSEERAEVRLEARPGLYA